jgi:hypothetical protein
MDLGKLNSNEKMAALGAVLAIVGPIVASAGFGFGAGGLTLILALAMLAIVFLPQFSPDTNLPGSKGSLMVIVGGIAAVSAGLALLSSIGYLSFFGSNLVSVLGWLIGIGGGLLMGWAGWQEFQSEGGKLQLGTAGTASGGASATAADAPAAPAAEAPAAEAPAPAVQATAAADDAAASAATAPQAVSDTATDAGAAASDAVDETRPPA